MQSISYSGLEHWLLVILAVIPSNTGSRGSRARDCPDDVVYSTNECLHPYNSIVHTMELNQQKFYSGVDVEFLRSLCQKLVKSMQCAHRIKEACPDTELSDIETVVGEYINIVELCSIDNVYDVYARHQACFTRLGASSERCYTEYRAETMNIMPSVDSGDSAALYEMCKYFRKMVKCIQTYVRTNCADQDAVDLVESLVKPSIKMSEHCRNDTFTTSTPVITTTTPAPKIPNAVEEHKSTSRAQALHTFNYSTFTSLLLFTVVILLK